MCAAHAAQSRRQNPAAREIAPVMLLAQFNERFVGALHDPLATDVDPGTRRHLTEHHQTFLVEFAKMLPVCAGRHKIRICNENPGCIGVRAKHARRLAGLNQQRLFVFELAQTTNDRVI